MKTVVLLTLLFTVFSTAYSQTTNGLVGSYLFNDGSLNDGSGSNNATASGGVNSTSDRFGNQNAAKIFDGRTSSYISLGNSSVLKPSTGTISLWVRVDGISSDGFGHGLNPIFTTKNGCNANWWRWPAVSLWVAMDQSQYLGWGRPHDCSNPHFPAPSNNPPTIGKWQHLVLSYKDDEVRFYVDGQLNVVSPKTFSTVFSSGDPLVLGNTLYPTSQRGFKGCIDDVLIYNRVLTDAEVLDLFNSPNPLLTQNNAPIHGESPCDGKWGLSEPSGSSLVLSSDGKRIKKVRYDGNNTVLTDNVLINGEKGWFEFTVENYGEQKPTKNTKGKEEVIEGDIKIGAIIDKQEYEFSISANQTAHWTFVNNVAKQSFIGTFKPEERLTIKQEVDQLLLQQEGETIARITGIPKGATQFYTKLSGLEATIKDPKMSSNLGCPPYAILKEKKDGGYIQQTDNTLRIKYIQEYAVDPVTEYADLPYKIYDWRRSVVLSGNLRVIYGANWKDIDIQTLAPNTYFTLEFEGNKEEQYTLRFKTK